MIDNDKTHSSVRDNGDLHIYDIQAYHEAGYFCTVSNGRDSVKSDAVKVTIIGESLVVKVTIIIGESLVVKVTIIGESLVVKVTIIGESLVVEVTIIGESPVNGRVVGQTC